MGQESKAKRRLRRAKRAASLAFRALRQVAGQHRLIWVERLGTQTMKGGDFDTTDSKFAVRMRYIYGYESPRGMWGENP